MTSLNREKERDFLQYVDIIRDFCADVTQRKIAELFQVTNGKKIGTYIERECKSYLEQRTGLAMEGSAALGKDLPLFNIDITEVEDLNVTPGIVQRIIDNPPAPGVLTISFALQWRLQYGRMKEAPFPEGVIVIL